MICHVPWLDIPPELIVAKPTSTGGDEDSTAASGRWRRRRRRDADIAYGGGSIWKLLGRRLWNFVRTGSWSTRALPFLARRKRAPVASISNANLSMNLYLGFVMDRYTALSNITKTKPNLRLQLVPYVFKCDNSPVTFDPIVNPLIKIKVIEYMTSALHYVSLTSLCMSTPTSVANLFF